MKKTKFMRAALLLLVLTLITSCFVGGTFAKYTTSSSGSDKARVAKWGVTVAPEGATFKNMYDSDTSATVVGESSAKVVAPGTKGDMVKMTLRGKPEVKVKVTYNGEVSLNGWTIGDNNEFYCPLIIKINGTAVDTSKATDAALFVKAINDAIDGYSKEYKAGDELDKKNDDSLAIAWEWPFANTDSSTKQTDEKDTALGNLTTAPTITVKVTTTVTQVD